MEVDHVLIAVGDLASSAVELEADYGLASVEGGRHTGWGTANRIVPLGDSYLELVAVVDEDEAAESAFGRWVAGGRSGRPLGWAVRTNDLDSVARRLSLSVRVGSRPAAHGGSLEWRSAGIEEAAAEPSLPFVIEWGRVTRFPGSAAVHHPAAATGIAQVILNGNPSRVFDWLGDHTLPIVVEPGRPAVAAVVVAIEAGEVVIGDARD